MLKILGMTSFSGKSVEIFLTIGSERLLHHDPISGNSSAFNILRKSSTKSIFIPKKLQLTCSSACPDRQVIFF